MAFDPNTIGSKYCMYLRKSRADEEQEKLTGQDTLSSHRTALYDFANRLGVVVSKEYAEVASGESLVERPEMLRLLEDVEDNKWDGVFVMSVDRLSRGNQRHQGIIAEAFMCSETYILTPQRVFNPLDESDMEIFDFDLFMSRREYKAINRRLIAGRVASCRRGEFIASNAPYGYAKARDGGRKTLVPNEHAPTVRRIFELRLSGMSVYKIAKTLTEEGVPTSKAGTLGGGRWNPASVHNILTNPAYAGLIRWNDESRRKLQPGERRKTKTSKGKTLIFEGLHPPIVSREEFDAVQEAFKRNRKPPEGGRVERNHYGRILCCSECGVALRYDQHRKNPYFIHHGIGGCRMKSCKVSNLDDLVVEWLKSEVENVTVTLDSEPLKSVETKRIELEGEARKARAAFDAAMDKLEKGLITTSEFKVMQAARTADYERAMGELEALEKQATDSRERLAKLHDLIDVLTDPDFDVAAKNTIVRSVIERINYTNHSPAGSDDEMMLEIILR